MTDVAIVEVSETPLDIGRHEAAVAHPSAGATVLFTGVVRENDHGRTVVELEYHGHPSAQQVLTEIAAEFASASEVLAIAVSHRVGRLEVGDVALVAAISTGHRGEAFALTARLVDEVKARLPIWKRQLFADGTDEWVNCP